jgi:hypothetical protein
MNVAEDFIAEQKYQHSLTNIQLWSGRLQQVYFGKTWVKMVVCVMEELHFAEVTLVKVSVCDKCHLHLDVSVQG